MPAFIQSMNACISRNYAWMCSYHVWPSRDGMCTFSLPFSVTPRPHLPHHKWTLLLGSVHARLPPSFAENRASNCKDKPSFRLSRHNPTATMQPAVLRVLRVQAAKAWAKGGNGQLPLRTRAQALQLALKGLVLPASTSRNKGPENAVGPCARARLAGQTFSRCWCA